MITYAIGRSLYLNITNRCSNDCCFCIRHTKKGLGEGYNLWLEKEPAFDEIIGELDKINLEDYDEVVFCGYGEPLERADDVADICRYLKSRTDRPVRINTNGQANLITGKNVPELLKGCVDVISISLNYPDAGEYSRYCRPIFGEKAFDAMLQFTRECKKYIPKVILSVVDVIGQERIEKCRKIAEDMGVEFRVRNLI